MSSLVIASVDNGKWVIWQKTVSKYNYLTGADDITECYSYDL